MYEREREREMDVVDDVVMCVYITEYVFSVSKACVVRRLIIRFVNPSETLIPIKH